jgi:hypothetical protein
MPMETLVPMVCRSSAPDSDRECIRRARGGTRNARPKTQFEFDVLHDAVVCYLLLFWLYVQWDCVVGMHS